MYIMTGGPATGKGTRAKVLSEALNIPHISTGDILRDVAKKSKKVSDMLEHGELIPDELITELVEERLSKRDCKNGFILDGYPRTIEQVELLDGVLERIGQKLDKVIELTVPDEIAYKRILERRKCKKCGKVYGVDFPPKVENVCDDCGGKLYIRSDDTIETLKNRIETYRENSKEILQNYKNRGVLLTIDSSSYSQDIVSIVTGK